MSAYFPIPSLHPAGHVFVGGAAAATVVLWWLATPLGIIGLLATLFCAYFFRNPDRAVPQRDGLMVSPADGRVLDVSPVVPPTELDLGQEPRVRISIFLNVFNVHVNRIAAAGKIRKKIYHAGKFLHAAADKASEDNERLSLVVDIGSDGSDYAQVQIAGFIARRILCGIGEGQDMRTGQRYGIIRFGSRMDVYLPKNATALVCPGQTMIGGETVLSDYLGTEPTRTGVTL